MEGTHRPVAASASTLSTDLSTTSTVPDLPTVTMSPFPAVRHCIRIAEDLSLFPKEPTANSMVSDTVTQPSTLTRR